MRCNAMLLLVAVVCAGTLTGEEAPQNMRLRPLPAILTAAALASSSAAADPHNNSPPATAPTTSSAPGRAPRYTAGSLDAGLPVDAKAIRAVIAKGYDAVPPRTKTPFIQAVRGKQPVPASLGTSADDVLLAKIYDVRMPSATINELLTLQPGLVERLDVALRQARPAVQLPANGDIPGWIALANTNPRAFLPRGLDGWQEVDATVAWDVGSGIQTYRQKEVGRFVPQLRIFVSVNYVWNERWSDINRQLDGFPVIADGNLHSVRDLTPEQAVAMCPAVLIPDSASRYTYTLSVPHNADRLLFGNYEGVLCKALGGIITMGGIVPVQDGWIEKVASPADNAKTLDRLRRISADALAKRPTAEELPALLRQQDSDLAAITDGIAKIAAAYAARTTIEGQFKELMKDAQKIDADIRSATSLNTALETDGGVMEVRRLDGSIEKVQLNRRNYDVRRQIEGQVADLNSRRKVLIELRRKFREAYKSGLALASTVEQRSKRLTALQDRLRLVAPDQIKPIPKPDPQQTGIDHNRRNQAYESQQANIQRIQAGQTRGSNDAVPPAEAPSSDPMDLLGADEDY